MVSRGKWIVLAWSLSALVCVACGGGGTGGGQPCGPGVSCPAGQECVSGVCTAPSTGGDGSAADTSAADICVPGCGERRCGPDGCGGTCGTCADGKACNESGLCVPAGCTPDCAGRQCGDDGCGGSCGTCPGESRCNQVGRCVAGPCTPDCTGRECGDDGCGGTCGACLAGETCSDAGQCQDGPCTPQCAGRDCGPDGCGGLCGACAAGEACCDGVCAAGACGECPLAIEGALQTDVTDVGFDAVSVRMTHKQDIDPFEDGCITTIEMEFTNGVGCRLLLGAGGAWDVGGGLRIDRLEFSADSQCRNFSDDREGEFVAPAGVAIGSIVPAAREVPDQNAATSCWATTLRVRIEPRTLDGESFEGEPRTLELRGSTLRVTGEVVSDGDTRARCPCVPTCDGRECGEDGCGGSCGSCGGNGHCEAGLCVCEPDCVGRECGDDGCGGSCGTCQGDLVCDEGDCVCIPDCEGRECGDDGCGGSCGSCAAGERCTTAGRCDCVPQCSGRECGPDGCGGTCGTCPAGEPCSANGRCGCEPSCAGRECGDDGCGGSCGACGWGETCESGGRCGCGDIDYFGCCEGTRNVWCDTDQLTGAETIRFEDCDSSCGWKDAQSGYVCGYTANGPADHPRDCDLPVCEPSCAGRECGDDGCGGSCGTCDAGESCSGGQCGPCQRQCAGRECGPDGCGGSCGSCPVGEGCTNTGVCASEPPLEEFGKPCTTDGDCFPGMKCGSLVGLPLCTIYCTPLIDTCPHGLLCLPNLTGTPPPDGFCLGSL